MSSMLEKHDKVFRIVSGAIRNASQAHPRWSLDPRFVSSIAKRAAGTLMAEMPFMLASDHKPRSVNPDFVSKQDLGDHSSEPLEGGDSLVFPTDTRRRAPWKNGHGARIKRQNDRWKNEWSYGLRILRDILGRAASKARKNKEFEKEKILIEILRLINKMVNSEKPNRKNPFIVDNFLEKEETNEDYSI